MQAAYRLVEEGEVEEELHQLAHGHLVGEHLGATEPEHQAGAERRGEGHGGRVDGPGAHDGERAFAEVFRAGSEAGVLVALAAEGLDLTDALEVVHEQGVHRARGLALDAVAMVGGEGIPECATDQEGQGDERDTGQHGVGAEENRQHADNAQDGDGALLGAVNEQALHGVHVLDDAGHEVARGALVEPADGEALQAGIDVAAEIEDDLLLQLVVEADAEAGEEFPQEKGTDERGHDRGEAAGVLLRDDLVNDVLGELGVGEGGGEGEQGEGDGAERHELVGQQIDADAPHDLAGRAGLRLETGVGVGTETGMGAHFRRGLMTGKGGGCNGDEGESGAWPTPGISLV